MPCHRKHRSTRRHCTHTTQRQQPKRPSRHERLWGCHTRSGSQGPVASVSAANKAKHDSAAKAHLWGCAPRPTTGQHDIDRGERPELHRQTTSKLRRLDLRSVNLPRALWASGVDACGEALIGAAAPSDNGRKQGTSASSLAKARIPGATAQACQQIRESAPEWHCATLAPQGDPRTNEPNVAIRCIAPHTDRERCDRNTRSSNITGLPIQLAQNTSVPARNAPHSENRRRLGKEQPSH